MIIVQYTIHRVYQSVCPFVGIGAPHFLPPPYSDCVSLSPWTSRGGRSNTPLRGGGWGDPIPTKGQTLWYVLIYDLQYKKYQICCGTWKNSSCDTFFLLRWPRSRMFTEVFCTMLFRKEKLLKDYITMHNSAILSKSTKAKSNCIWIRERTLEERVWNTTSKMLGLHQYV